MTLNKQGGKFVLLRGQRKQIIIRLRLRESEKNDIFDLVDAYSLDRKY